MAESFPPPVCCVYQIRCVPTRKIYIGSANNLRLRWQRHVRRLRSGNHENRPLQEAWNKYGEASFCLSILELVPREQLLRAEQVWLDGSGCTQRSRGFNLRPIACAAGESLWLKWEGFIDPSGRPVTIENLEAHCRMHDLSPSAMHQLARGLNKRKSHKGWTYRDRIRERPYPNIKTWSGFIDPDGQRVSPITNLAAFCRHRGLTHSHMIALAAGRICSHQGWTHAHGRKRLSPRTYEGFINPTGQRVSITGVRRSHKGWTWRP